MKVLIIGGTGNISTFITLKLIEKEEDVILYNRGNKTIKGARNIIGDRTNYNLFRRQMEELLNQLGTIDCVIDMVCYTPTDAEVVVETFKKRIGQLIFCSTVDVYTKPAVRYPIKEDFERKPNPSFVYAYNKAVCENILELASEKNYFPVTILRPAATYNDTSTPISLIGPGISILKRIKDRKPIIILGDGTSFWTSSHSIDVANAFVNAIGNTKAFNKAYNVTGDEWITWIEYYLTVARVMKTLPIDFVYIPTDLLGRIAPKKAEWCVLNFRYNNIFDNTLAKNDLNYRYTINWEEGVKRMVDYHMTQGNLENAPVFPFYDLIVEKFRNMSERLIEELSPLDK